MTNQHPIIPPHELVQEWAFKKDYDKSDWIYEQFIATQAAEWGANQELLACGNYLEKCAAWEPEDVTEFYNYRRPKPPSLKAQALGAVQRFYAKGHEDCTDGEMKDDFDIIRRALEQLDD